MDSTASFGYWLRRRRKARDLTQQELARQVGCALETIRKIETDVRRPSRQMAERLADCLRVPSEERAAFLQVARAELATDRLVVGDQPINSVAQNLDVPHAPPATPLPSGTVTFLYTDIEDSAALAQHYPAALPKLLTRHHAILRQSIEAYRGHVFQITGDAFCTAFHTAADALQAAIQAQGQLQAEPWQPAVVNVRMGIHTGAAQAGASEAIAGGYDGYLTLIRVQRVMSAAHGGQVLLSNASAELVRGQLPEGVTLRDLGEYNLKGLLSPERVWQLVAVDLRSDFPPLVARSAIRNNLPLQLSSFIGREREIADVQQLLSTTRLLTLTGVGGTGKTRLVRCV